MRLATEADTDGIARVARAAFDPATDAIARHLFPVRLQLVDSSEEDPAITWRRIRKGIKQNTERIVLMVVTDDELNDKIVGFSMWEEPVPAGHVEKEGAAGKQLVPCKTLDEEAYKTLRRVSEEATVGYFGKDGSKHMWCECGPHHL